MRRIAILLALSCACLTGASGPATAGVERAEATLSLEAPLTGPAVIRLDNLLGTVSVRGGGDPGTVRVEATVVAEAETAELARELAATIRLERRDSPEGTGVHVVWPVDRYTAFRPPKDGGMLTKWITPLLRKKTVAAVYDERTVQLGPARGATVLTVHVDMTVPHDVTTSVRQFMGSVETDMIRGVLEIENVEGQVTVGRIYGGVSARSGEGDLSVLTAKGQRVQLETAGGHVQVVDAAVDELHVRTGSGSIEGRAIRAGRMTVLTDGGAVGLTELDGHSFDVATGTGDIDVQAVLQRTRDASIRSETGDVTLRVGKIAPFELTAQTTAGEVKARDGSFEVAQEMKSEARVRRGTGGADLQVSTGSGEVVLRTQ